MENNRTKEEAWELISYIEYLGWRLALMRYDDIDLEDKTLKRLVDDARKTIIELYEYLYN